MLHIMDAELIEGNYVLYQGDLSTNCVVVGKSSVWVAPLQRGPEHFLAWPQAETWKKVMNASHSGPQARL
ncbi:hypothetical protein [Pseudomonas maioricensis]|uniref:hypothetical protein n=1 Tax=Pseudomonas maioricensis TaxID=1766623 RepID=UPI001FAE3F2F|nr:hypothetical protein [Pseudomonas sp. S25]